MAAISQDDRAYRRGVVFGFTVAEVVLLLVFCLLLLFVPMLLDNPANKPVGPTYTPVPAPPAVGGNISTGASSPKAVPAPGDPAAYKDPKDKSEPPMSDPSGAGKSTTPPPEPLPKDWIRVAPNPGNPNPGREGNAQPTQSPPGLPAAATPFDALPLASVCERLGIPAGECRPAAVDSKLSSLGRHNWPPIIRLKEADGFYFVSGEARVSNEFRTQLSRLVPRILELVAEYKTNVIEIVGHTDEQPVLGIPSNLDKLALEFTAKGDSAVQLTAADNAGLGFARALAVVQILRSDKRLEGLTIVPLSAAQMVDLDGKLADGTKSGDTKERRRIELRVRQSSGEEAVGRPGR